MPVPPASLAALPLLVDCSPGQVADLARGLTLRRLGSGETLMVEGESASDFALLLVGQVDISRASEAEAERLGEAGPGAILGELALLRGAPRSATVTARTPCTVATGTVADLECLLDLPGVHDRVRDLASARLAQDVRPVMTVTRDGTELLLRPLLASDRAAYLAALGGMSAAALRSRFFQAGQPTSRMVDYLIELDFVDHFAWAALRVDTGDGVAAARYVRSRTDPGEAEIALAVVDDHQARGVGRLMVGALGVASRAAGIERLVAWMQADNTAVRALLARAGSTFSTPEPGVVAAALRPADAIDLLEPSLAAALERSSREVVTAAGLALT